MLWTAFSKFVLYQLRKICWIILQNLGDSLQFQKRFPSNLVDWLSRALCMNDVFLWHLCSKAHYVCVVCCLVIYLEQGSPVWVSWTLARVKWLMKLSQTIWPRRLVRWTLTWVMVIHKTELGLCVCIFVYNMHQFLEYAFNISCHIEN